jgi:hypothetical protein
MAKGRKPIATKKAETSIEEEENARAVDEREDKEMSAEGDLADEETDTKAVAPAAEEEDADKTGDADVAAGSDDEEEDRPQDALALAVRLRAAGEPDAITLARAWAGLKPGEIAAKIELRQSIRAAVATAR